MVAWPYVPLRSIVTNVTRFPQTEISVKARPCILPQTEGLTCYSFRSRRGRRRLWLWPACAGLSFAIHSLAPGSHIHSAIVAQPKPRSITRVKQSCPCVRAGCGANNRGRARGCQGCAATSSGVVANLQRVQSPAHPGWAESVASAGCHVRSGARDRPIVRSAPVKQ
jgi:hypothetical protein